MSDLGIVAALERSMRTNRTRIALSEEGKHWTYAQLDAASSRFANSLATFGVKPGDRVVLALGNRREYVSAFIGCLRVGAIVVPVNQMLSATDVSKISGHAEPSLIVAGIDNKAQMDESSGRVVLWGHGDGDPEDELTPLLATMPETIDSVAIDDLATAVLVYTGGTTGAPKGVAHTGRSLGMNAWSQLLEGEIRRDERLVLSTPLSHAAGFFLLPALCRGAMGIVLDGFDPDRVARAVVEQGGTWTYMVPTMIYRWLDANIPERYDLTNLNTVVYGAAAVMGQRIADAVRRHGPIFIQQYGQTEVPTFATVLTKEDHRAALAADTPREFESAGSACAMCEIDVVDGEGASLPQGEVGEVVVRSPYTMGGYHHAPEATAEVFHGDWLRTGDVGRMSPDGRLYLLDRMKDMVITGGMNVYTREVEEEIQRFEPVRQVACFGLPDPKWGERLEAAVVLHDDTEVRDPDALRALFRTALTSYKQPKRVHVMASLPTTPFGKFDKKELRLSLGE